MQSEYKAWNKAAWEEVHGFYDSATTAEDFYGPANPQHRLAPEFFEFYRRNRPGRDATHALSNALVMWSNLKGVSHQVQQEIRHISIEEDVWEEIASDLPRIFCADDREEEGLALLRDLAERVVPLKGRTALLFELSTGLMEKGEATEAREGFDRIIEWNASEKHVIDARGYIHELDHLNPGQPAPLFTKDAVDGASIDLAGFLGRVVLLHFWGTSCGFCKLIYPDLRSLFQEYSVNDLALVGLSYDQDPESLRSTIREQRFTWPQICEGNGWKDEVFRLYNVRFAPTAYVIDRSGSIARKITGGDRGDELRELVRSLA
ncbi:MAG: TlpA disulfide reductase family protein [Gemmatimonadaceae bacterium]|nr:TlpA disulfide reductase family protein [Gemmatimonadaceae bacterium]